MLIAVPTETRSNETRVALTPSYVSQFVTLGHKIIIEKDAGLRAGFSNEDYLKAGAQIAQAAQETYHKADIILKIWAPTEKELPLLSTNQTILCNTQNLSTYQQLKNFSTARINLFALDLIPRISRAQNMDILSSQDTLAGYEAALLGAQCLKNVVPLLITAAGTLPAVKALIIGLGVAGLQASATLHRLGAQVYATDKRPETKEQAVSAGGIFIKEITPDILSAVKLIITSAVIRGKSAPITLSSKQLSYLSPNTVIIDMAADSGGNIQTDKISPQLILIQDTHLARRVPTSASQLYAGNIFNFCKFLLKNNKLQPDFNDEIIAATAICCHGQINHPYLTGK